MMYADCYFVDKESGTYSDTLVAFGLAHLLTRVLQDAEVPSQVTLKDLGTTYLVQLATPLTQEIVDCASYPHELLPFIQNNNEDKYPDGAKRYPLREYFELLGSKTAGTVGQENAEQATILEIPDDFNIFSIIKNLQGHKIWNRFAERLWKYRLHYPNILRIVLNAYFETPNGLNNAVLEFDRWKRTNGIKSKDFDTDDSLVTVFVPTSQKSINRAKPESAKNEGQSGFWLPEWLKMVGMPHCTLVVSVRSGNSKFMDEDKKVYALAPSYLNMDTHTSVLQDFRKTIRRNSSIKADIEVLLNYVENLLLHIQRSGQQQRFGRLRNIVAGFHCAYFKKSGPQTTAFSLTNLPFIQLPAWVRFKDIPTDEEISGYQNIIKHQHEVLFYHYNDNGNFVDFVDENRSEGCALLHNYRGFLSEGSLPNLLDFFAGFAALIMQQAAQKKKYKQFTLSQVRRLLEAMQPTLQEILDDEGFREVARAIRLCTVTAQRLKAKDKKTHHDIRYGLAQELKRKAPFKHEFSSAIMEFIYLYQSENARYRERGGSNIHEITTTHVRSLSALIDNCSGTGAEPVASLLLAFGYAYDDDAKEDNLGTDTIDNATQEVTQ